MRDYSVDELIELLCNDDIENALRMDIAEGMDIKDVMLHDKRSSMFDIEELSDKISRKLEVLHTIIDIKRGRDNE